MIYLYSGTPGSGKSVHAARVICNWARVGAPVIGNFKCALSRYKKAKFYYIPNDELTPDVLVQFSREQFQGKKIKEDSILLVIDECQLLFNARDWQQRGRNQWLSFFTQHRKYGYQIILVAQFDRMIDKQIRSLIEYEVIHRKISNFGWKGKVISALSGGTLFVSVKKWYPLKEKVSSEFFHAKKSLYSIYDTYAVFGEEQSSSAASDEVQGIQGPLLPEAVAAEPSLPDVEDILEEVRNKNEVL